MHGRVAAASRFRCHQKQKALVREAGLDSQTLAALGATCVDDSAATAGLHANEEPVGACAADFGRLVSAFHGIPNGPFRAQCELLNARRVGLFTPTQSREPRIITNFLNQGNTLGRIQLLLRELRARAGKMWIKY